MERPVTSAAELQRRGIAAFFRPRDVEAAGLTYRDLERLVAAGEVEKIGRGLYRIASAEASELETVAMVASAVPAGIVCLLSALRLHGLGTQEPHEVWLAIDRKARRPGRLPSRIRLVRFSGPMLAYGVVERHIAGVRVRVTSPARTVVDCFRYRSKVGLDVALEALRDALRTRAASPDQLVRAADACRARTVVAPYLEAALA